MSISIINIKNINFGSVVSSTTLTNTDSTQCKSVYPTSAEVKCSLPSSLVNVKSIKDISVSGNFNSLTEVVLRIDTDYSVPGNLLPQGQDRLIHLEGALSLSLSGDAIISSDLSSIFSSVRVSGNKVEALIPPSSCFNLHLSETITEVIIPFSVTDYGMSLQGLLTANVVGVNYNELTPCT